MSLVAVDLGGTWIRAAVVSPEGACGAVARRPTENTRPPDAIVHDLAGTIKDTAAAAGLKEGDWHGAAIAVATVVDENGLFLHCDNLPTMDNYPIRRELQERLPVPFDLFNDATSF